MILLALPALALADAPSPPVPPTNPAPVFQMRLVADAPSEETEEMLEMTRSDNPNDWPKLQVQKKVLLDQTCVKSAFAFDEAGSGPVIAIQFTEEGGTRFAEVTKHNLNRRLAIVISGTLYSAPTIRAQITDGHAQITGRFTMEEARALAAKIEAALRK